MVNNVKAGYVNPLTMMKKSRQAKQLNPGMLKAEEKKQKELEAKKQSIQNSLLLMKGTSGNGEVPEENIELLEKKLEDITNEIRANTPKSIEAVMTGKEDKGRQEEEANTLPRKDTVIISSIGRSSRMQQNAIKPIELKKEGQDKIAVYNNIIRNSDDGINRPTVDSQLKNAYAGYFNEVFEKGKAPEEDMYEYIVNIHVDSLAKAYQDVYNDIVKGYEDGTREVWTQNFDEGADYIEFRLDGKNYRFHKLSMEEELEQLNNAYDETAKDVELRANAMIDQEKMLAKFMPEYEAKKKDIEAQLARREGIEVEKGAEMLLERIKDKVTPSEDTSKEFNIYEMLMEARTSWLKQFAEID